MTEFNINKNSDSDPVPEMIHKDSTKSSADDFLQKNFHQEELISFNSHNISTDTDHWSIIDSVKLDNYYHDTSESEFFINEQQIPAILHNNILINEDIYSNRMPDWYFLAIIFVLVVMIWIRIWYNKFLLILFENSISYFLASKSFKEQNIVQKRFGFTLDILYLINGSLFLLLLIRYFKWDLPVTGDFKIFCASFGLLLSLLILRIMFMRITGYIFNRISLFSECLYHYYIYNKVLSVLLIPFLISIPYTNGILHEIVIITAISIVGIVYLMRAIRLIIYTIKNVVLLFYLILYLCTLEIIPLLVVFKIILSLR